jgi:glutamine---fructose-6-phosphate transaminase (isomerizing)
LTETKTGRHTIAEILSEPETWNRCLTELESKGQLRALDTILPRGREWAFIGCGSSYYVAVSAAATWTLLTGEPARALPASEVLLFPQNVTRPCQPVLISRSGRTTEVVEAAHYLERELGIPTLGLTCGADTPLEKVSSHHICIRAADEKSTVMTRSFTSMLLTLQALAAVRAADSRFLEGIAILPELMQDRLRSIRATIESVVRTRQFADYVFLAQGPFWGVAQESMLKVKEMSCSYAQCFHTLEFRHGPKAIVSPETLLTFFLSESGFARESAVLEEIRAMGGVTLAITNSADAVVRRSADFLIELTLSVPEAARAAAAVIPGQLLGFHTGIRKGFNPDEPRNLTRVVTLGSGENGGLEGDPA